MSTCGRCGAAIVWVRTPAGKAMPCDARAVYIVQEEGGPEKGVLRDGRVVSCRFVDERGWKEIDPYKHYPYPGGIVECPSCGLEIDDCYENYNFCPRCGAAATDEAVDMLIKRLEALYGQENT